MRKSLCEEEVFSGVFREYAETLFRYLYYKCGDKGLAQDLAQEAFVRMWNNCKDVNPEAAKGYAFRAANNLLLNHYEHQKVVLKFEKQNHRDRSHEDPSYLMEEQQLKEQLEAAISALPVKQREAFLLSRIEKKTYNEIAEMLGISRQAVEKRIYSALDKLRKVSEKIR